jgi:hypothetical protein
MFRVTKLGRLCGLCFRISQKPESDTKDDPLGQDELVVLCSQGCHHEIKSEYDGSRSEQQSWSVCVEEPTDKASLQRVESMRIKLVTGQLTEMKTQS